jgi:5-methyltetrahydropteroyltriglutamate--homocysteine methyltransferase
MSQTPPFRADVVGSYLRPDYLHQARQDFADGRINKEKLKAIEDKAITELVAKQKATGLQVITDGEFRRSWWHLDFMWGLGGVEQCTIDAGYKFVKIESRPVSVRLTDKISGENHPFIDHFKFLLQFAEDGIVPRLTVPAPAQFLKELQRGDNRRHTATFYPDEAALISDIARAYQLFIQELYGAGCRSLQFDDCTWGMLTDPKIAQESVAAELAGCNCGQDHGEPTGDDLDKLLNKFLTVNNSAIEGAPEDLTITTHVCRGNFRSTWLASGGYGPVAHTLLGKENVDAFYLEFDTDRAGSFEPLAELAAGKKVVLGLISSKLPTLEKVDDVIARIQEASQYVPLEDLYLSTQCGFASTEEGNKLTEEEQWAKIALVQEVAGRVWP